MVQYLRGATISNDIVPITNNFAQRGGLHLKSFTKTTVNTPLPRRGKTTDDRSERLDIPMSLVLIRDNRGLSDKGQ